MGRLQGVGMIERLSMETLGSPKAPKRAYPLSVALQTFNENIVSICTSVN